MSCARKEVIPWVKEIATPSTTARNDGEEADAFRVTVLSVITSVSEVIPWRKGRSFDLVTLEERVFL